MDISQEGCYDYRVRYDVDEMTVKFLVKQESYNAAFSNKFNTH